MKRAHPVVLVIVRAVLAVFFALLFAASAEPQIPRPLTPPYNTYQIRQHLTTANFTTVRTVCPSGCDFATPSVALAYVATQTRSLARQWTVVVYGGVISSSLTPNMSYTEISLSVPSYTTLRGYPGSAPSGQSINSTSNPVIELTATSGTQLTLGTAAGISGLTFYTNAILTADMVMAKTTGGDVNMLENVQLWGNAATGSFAFDILSCESTSVVALNVNTIRGQNGPSSTVRNVIVKAGLGHFQLGRHQPGQGTGQLKTIEVLGGSLRLTWVRIIPGATTDLTVTSGSANVQYSLLASFTGAVTTDTLFSVNGTSNPATCSAGQLFVNTTSNAPKICACTSPGVWKCSNLN